MLVADEKGNLKWWDLTRFIDFHESHEERQEVRFNEEKNLYFSKFGLD